MAECKEMQLAGSRYMSSYIHTSVKTEDVEECKRLCAEDRNCS